jgi:CDP-diglyceride synthetase
MDITRILLAIPLILLVFWAWMFWEMIHDNEIPERERTTWLVLFILLNVIAAGYYYFTYYRNR